MSKNKKSATRIYAVVRKGHGNTRLVKATTIGAALRHVAKHEYTVKPASQDQIVEAIEHGVKVESALKVEGNSIDGTSSQTQGGTAGDLPLGDAGSSSTGDSAA